MFRKMSHSYKHHAVFCVSRLWQPVFCQAAILDFNIHLLYVYVQRGQDDGVLFHCNVVILITRPADNATEAIDGRTKKLIIILTGKKAVLRLTYFICMS